MEKLIINSFKYGLDSRRTELTSNPGTLETGENGIIDAGGVFRKRMAFVPFSNLAILDGSGDQGTFGWQDTDTGPMAFGSALAHGVASTQNQPVLASVMPVTTPQVVYQQLQHPEVVDGLNYNRVYHLMTRVVSSKNYQGKAFVAAKFADGNTFLYYNGTLVDSSRNGLVLPNSTSLALLGSDLARQINDLDGWVGTANTTGHAYTGSTTPQATITLTGSGHGGTLNLTIAAGLITAVTVGNAGVGYAAGDTLLVVDATGMGALLQVFTVVGGGALDTLLIISSGPVTQNGTDVVASPPGADFTAVATKTSTAGLLGAALVDLDNVGVAAQAAKVAFIFTGLAGNVTVTTFSDAAGTVPVTLYPTAAVTGTIQLDIVNYINRNTQFHGYTANISASPSSAIVVTITAPTSLGAVTFNLTVTVTGGGSVAAATPVGPFTITVSPTNPSAATVAKKKTTLSVLVSASTSNGGGTPTFLWSEVGTASGIKMSSTTGGHVTFSMGLAQGEFVIGQFQCVATDSTGTTALVTFPVSLSNNPSVTF
jgi:hypothetical protein